ncbi:MFS transporter [Actinomycetospora endophytica]|uniref:MFS transporter n=1 Tax=Actinomycetospora endophytica TaxID=2291215 RepID=A0ABS8PGY5_9PSEU|nr:MFS transporter [Actinomycetospora endophytica]MCD2196254.1 MFS transporter [Actinomycetospora endophytica]
MTALLARLRPSGDANAFDRRLIAPMILGSILNPVNSSLIAVALVPIGIALGAPASETAWLVAGLYIATAVGQPVTGRLVDLYGPRPLYLVGTALVGIGGLLGALAPDIWTLVGARVLLGLGTCAGYPAAMSMIRGEARRTGRDSPEGILTLLSISTQTIAVIGPTLGGLLIGLGGWRTTFTVNVPLALACLVLGARRLPRGTRRDRTTGLAATLDPAGIVLFAVTLVALLLVLLHPAWWPLLAVVVAAGTALAVWELRAAHPFLDLRVLGGNVPLLVTFLRALLAATVTYCLLYGFTQWLEQGRGLSPSVAGLVLLPIFITGIGVAAISGRRRELRGKLLVGAAGQVIVSVLLFFLGDTSAIWFIVVVTLIAGVPQGLNTLAVQNATYRQSDPARVASSAGLMRTFFYLGAIAASTTGGIAFAHGATTPGLHDLALVMLVASALFLVITVADRSLGRLTATQDRATQEDPA